MEDLADRIALRIVLTVATGPALQREWTWGEVLEGRTPQWLHFGPPPWLREPEMSWHDPRGAVVARGLVPRGMEDAARELLYGPGEAPELATSGDWHSGSR